jgi:hypothetical protein
MRERHAAAAKKAAEEEKIELQKRLEWKKKYNVIKEDYKERKDKGEVLSDEEVDSDSDMEYERVLRHRGSRMELFHARRKQKKQKRDKGEDVSSDSGMDTETMLNELEKEELDDLDEQITKINKRKDLAENVAASMEKDAATALSSLMTTGDAPVDDTTSTVLAVAAVADSLTKVVSTSALSISAKEVKITSTVKDSIQEVVSAPSIATNVEVGATDTVPLTSEKDNAVEMKDDSTPPASASKLSSPQTSEKDTAVETRIDDAFPPATEKDTALEMISTELHHLSLKNEIADIGQQMSQQGMLFLVQMYGRGIMIPPLFYQVCDLAEFANLMASDDFYDFASSKNDQGKPVLKLHYFAGVNVPHDKSFSSEQVLKHCVEIQTFIENYFYNDSKIIKTCVWNARTLYITATSNEGSQDIVACLNYCVLPNNGIFVNWIVVKDEKIGLQLYGGAIAFHCGNNNNWRRQKLAIMLLQVARIAFVCKMYFDKAFANDNSFAWRDYCIILQCRSSNNDAIRFFHAATFTELDHVDRESEVDNQTYDGFLKQRNALAKSKTDYIHFIIGGKDDLVVLKHVSDGYKMKSTSTTGKQAALNVYKSLLHDKHSQKLDLLFFPFRIKREHILILSQGLDLFYLPFQEKIVLDGYLTPNKDCYIPNSITVYASDLNIASSPLSWYNDTIIDFMSRW